MQQEQWIRTYFEQLQIEVITVGYTRVNHLWRNVNVAPMFSCLYFIEDGEGWIKIKGQEYDPKPGQLYILPAGVVHSYSTSNDHPFLKYWCHFNAKVGDLHLFHMIDMPNGLQAEDPAYVRQLFRKMHEASQGRHLTDPLVVKTAMLELLTYMVGQQQPERVRLTSSRQIEKLNEIVAYIEAHLSEDLSLERLAKVASYSPKYFIQFFKSMLNMPPIQYVNKTRIDRAKRLLMTTDRSLSDIAAEVGMETNYFSKLFKQYTNLPPGHFRNINMRS